jgi:hypothetical protein
MKRAQFNFTWLFAIIVGVMILFFAIYGAMKLGDTQRFKTDTEIAKRIQILTDPLQAGFAEGKHGKIEFNQETKIENFCLDGGFGRHEISVATRSDVGKEWNIAGEAVSVQNKYIFSSRDNSGKEYYVFSKPFEYPYKVNDLIFLTPESYCFISAPEEIVEEIEGLAIPNIEIGNCSEGSLEVCFGSGNCEINVYGSCLNGCDSLYDEGTVEKPGVQMKYVGSLMYGAIFSDKGIYDCNVKRLMYRTAKIAEGFVEKTDLMDSRGCGTNLKGDLYMWMGVTINGSVNDLIGNNQLAKTMNKQNDRELCGVW